MTNLQCRKARQGLFSRKERELDGCQAGLLHFRDGLHLQVLQLPALAPDNGHNPLLGNEKLLAGQHLQGFITEFYQVLVSSFGHKFKYMLQN